MFPTPPNLAVWSGVSHSEVDILTADVPLVSPGDPDHLLLKPWSHKVRMSKGVRTGHSLSVDHFPTHRCIRPKDEWCFPFVDLLCESNSAESPTYYVPFRVTSSFTQRHTGNTGTPTYSLFLSPVSSSCFSRSLSAIRFTAPRSRI